MWYLSHSFNVSQTYDLKSDNKTDKFRHNQKCSSNPLTDATIKIDYNSI